MQQRLTAGLLKSMIKNNLTIETNLIVKMLITVRSQN